MIRVRSRSRERGQCSRKSAKKSKASYLVKHPVCGLQLFEVNTMLTTAETPSYPFWAQWSQGGIFSNWSPFQHNEAPRRQICEQCSCWIDTQQQGGKQKKVFQSRGNSTALGKRSSMETKTMIRWNGTYVLISTAAHKRKENEKNRR